MSGEPMRPMPFLKHFQRMLTSDRSDGPEGGYSQFAIERAKSEPSSTQTLRALVFGALARCREQTLTRIRRVNEMTSREVLAAGSSLSEIVTRAQTQVGSARQALAELTDNDDSGVAALVDRQTRMTKKHLESIRGALAAQVQMTQRATEAGANIVEIGKQVTDVAQAARMLSLNASIEGARLGSIGVGITVIAAEMRSLTNEINQANSRIENMATLLLATLPQIVEQTQVMSQYAEEFAVELASNASAVGGATDRLRKVAAETVAGGDRHITLVLKESQAALSHLQFQDPAAQSLLIIDADLARAEEYVRQVIDAAEVGDLRVDSPLEFELTAADAHRDLNAGEVVALDGTGASEAGEVLLF
jgi:hypothetical protein